MTTMVISRLMVCLTLSFAVGAVSDRLSNCTVATATYTDVNGTIDVGKPVSSVETVGATCAAIIQCPSPFDGVQIHIDVRIMPRSDCVYFDQLYYTAGNVTTSVVRAGVDKITNVSQTRKSFTSSVSGHWQIRLEGSTAANTVPRDVQIFYMCIQTNRKESDDSSRSSESDSFFTTEVVIVLCIFCCAAASITCFFYFVCRRRRPTVASNEPTSGSEAA